MRRFNLLVPSLLLALMLFHAMHGVYSAAANSQKPMLLQMPLTQSNQWISDMRQVHARFTGQTGTFAHFGDSITVTMAFWAPLLYERKNAPMEMQQAFAAVKDYVRP